MTGVPPAVPEPGEPTLAGLWSSTLQSLADRAAHELKNALNGAVMNVEVVRTLARPGSDAGALATFAEAAAVSLEEVGTRAEGLLALARAPRASVDAAVVVRHASALLAPALAAAGIALEVDGARSCPVSGNPLAARLAIVAALLTVADAALAALAPTADHTAGVAGTDSAVEPARHLRCTTISDGRPLVELAPRQGAMLPSVVERVLAAEGIHVSADRDSLRLALPAYSGA